MRCGTCIFPPTKNLTTSTWDHYCLLDGVNGFLTQVVGSQLFPSWYTDWMAIYFDCQPAMDVEPWFPTTSLTSETPPKLNCLAGQAFFFTKGAAYVRMMALHDMASFRFQMTQYFSHRGCFTKAKILYNDPNSLVETSKMETYMNRWNKLDCFPLVTVIVSGTGKVTLEQNVFGRRQTQETIKSASVIHERLPFPVTCFELDQPKKVRTVWFEDNGHPIMLQNIMRPFKLNWHQSGAFRVNYTKEMWVNFAKQINEEKTFDPEDKANLLDDAFTLAEYGHIHHGIPLSLVVYLRAGTEMHPLPWLTAAKHLKNMYHRTINTDITFLLEFFVKLLCTEYAEDELTWMVAKQPVLDVIRRVAIVDLSGTFLFEEVINRLKFTLNEFLEHDTIPLEWKRPVFEHALKGESVDNDLYETLFARYKEEANVFKKCMFWTALVGVQDENYIEQLYEIAKEIDELEDDKWNTLVRLKILSTNCLSHRHLWPYIMETYPEYSLLPENEKDSIKGILIHIIDLSRSPEILSEVGEFGESNGDLDVQCYAQKVKFDCDRWNAHNYMLFVEEWLHLYIMNST